MNNSGREQTDRKQPEQKHPEQKHLVGLCIVYRNRNYGSMLQSFATLVKLEELGVDYEIIDYSHPHTLQFYAGALGRLANRDFLYSKARLIRKKAGQKLHPDYAANEAVRGKRFDRFKSKERGSSIFPSPSAITTGSGNTRRNSRTCWWEATSCGSLPATERIFII